MTIATLTPPSHTGHTETMRADRHALRALAAISFASTLAGCITVKAPSEPIVIELNINITQEIIYRLAEDVRDNIDANPEIF